MKSSGFEFTARALSMERLATALYSPVGRRRVIDKTGLTGLYDFQMVFADPFKQQAPADMADDTLSADFSAPTIFTALQEQLGLRLESAKAPVDHFVIDSVEKPSEN